MNNKQQLWILAGYDLFSKEGPKGLKIEVLSRKVNKSKSSFYHHFADLDGFTESLLNYHLERSKIIAEREKQCKIMVPDMLDILLEAKQDLLFNRQLRINRDILAFRKCFEKTDKEFENTFLDIWAETLGLSHKRYLAQIVLNQTIENFYLQITEETLTYEWLFNYIFKVREMVNEFIKNN